MFVVVLDHPGGSNTTALGPLGRGHRCSLDTYSKRSVSLEIEADGVQVEGPRLRRLNIGARSVAALPFTLRFTKAGSARIRVLARAADIAEPGAVAAGKSDAVERRLLVRPDGQPLGFAASALSRQAHPTSRDILLARLEMEKMPPVYDYLVKRLRKKFGDDEKVESAIRAHPRPPMPTISEQGQEDEF